MIPLLMKEPEKMMAMPMIALLWTSIRQARFDAGVRRRY